MELTDNDLMAKKFVDEMGMLADDRSVDEAAHSQFDVVMEEIDELITAFHEGDAEDVAEEQADVIVTVKILSAIMGINSDKAYKAKMEYNLQKNGSYDEFGKVEDDAEVEKPDFEEFTSKEKTW